MIVRRAMADYAHRYESAAEMLADLEVVAAASDPWSVKPAMLPSMGGHDSSAMAESEGSAAPESAPESAPVAPVAAVSTVRRTPPPPPPVAAAPRRPEIQVTGWWTGGYAAADGARRRAHEQVASARRRASTRRKAVPSRSRSGVSLVLGGMVAGLIAFVIGAVMVMESTGSRYGGSAVRVASGPSATEFAMGSIFEAPGTDDGRRVIVIDEQGPIDEQRLVRLAPVVEEREALLLPVLAVVPFCGKIDASRWA